MYYNDFYTDGIVQSQASSVDTTWMIISAILALVGGIVIYILFISKPNNGEYTGFVAWLHDFLNFKSFFIEMVLKTLYVVTTLFIVLSSFCFLGTSIAIFFLWLILGNIINRLLYEFVLMLLVIVRNTTEINNKMRSYKKEEKVNSPKSRKKVQDSEEEKEEE